MMKSREFTTRNGSSIQFTSVGLGTGPLGELFAKLDEKTSIATVEAAFSGGVRLFDSSPHYGNGLAESRLGAGLRHAPRDEIVVSTKIGRIMEPRGKKPESATVLERVGCEVTVTDPRHSLSGQRLIYYGSTRAIWAWPGLCRRRAAGWAKAIDPDRGDGFVVSRDRL
jgi:aryl-alcohol dehydrogenase-like predicted oxidoreductase